MTMPPSPTETLFQSIHCWDGNMPDAQGSISKNFNAVPKPDHQIEHCEKMTQFLLNQTDLVTLNLDTTIVPFIIAVLGNTHKVRVVFGVGSGFGLNGINANPLQNTVLVLHGKHEQNVTIPTVHVLPSDTLALQEFNIPYDNDYNQDRLKVANETPNNK
jgi:hypothetical protein